MNFTSEEESFEFYDKVWEYAYDKYKEASFLPSKVERNKGKAAVKKETKAAINKQVKGAFIGKLCGATRNSLDSMFISSFLGLTSVAIYDNYYYILRSVHNMLNVATTSMIGGVGNSIAKESVEKNHWISDEDMNNIIVVAESTPGPIAINSATFIGYKTGKFLGAFFAVLGVILPSLIIITIIYISYKTTKVIIII